MNATPSLLFKVTSDPFESPEHKTVCFSMLRRLKDLEPLAALPDGYQMDRWSWRMLPAASAVLRVAFVDTKYLDLYPRLSSRQGCAELISELIDLPGFMPEASWLLSFDSEPAGLVLCTRSSGCVFGQIHVVAVAPRHRMNGLGTHLLHQAIWSLNEKQLHYAMLKICRTNRHAIRFFRKNGFRVGSSGITRK